MNTEIEKLFIIFGSALGVILFGTLLINRSDKNVELEKPKTLGRRPKSFLTRKQKTRKTRFHSNKLETILENSKESVKSKTLKSK